MVNLPSTNHALLLALQSQSPARREAAWESFEPCYRPVILAWCRKRSLSPDAAEELTQDILLKLSFKFLNHFYDPDRGRFRAWLKAFVGNLLTDYWRARQRQPDPGAQGGTDNWRLLANLESPESAHQLTEAIANQPATKALQAVARVRARVLPTHWEAFWLYHFEKRPVPEIATQMGLATTNVYKVLQRLRRQLEEEIDHG